MKKRGAALIVPILVACSGATDEHSEAVTAAASGARLPCAVDAILERSCRGCHASPPVFGAPMPLATWGDLQAASPADPSKKVFERLKARVHATSRPMPPPPNARLTDGELAVIDRWVDEGTPAAASSSTCEAGDGGTPTTQPLSCAPDLHIAPTTPWTMPETSDDVYVCYGFDVTNAQKRHVVGLAPKIDNPAILHHLLLFQADRAVSSTPTRCSGNSSKWRIVYGWAPGGRTFELPPEAGFPQEGTTHYVMQVHYNNALHRPNQQDASGFDMCTTDRLRPNDADTIAFGSVRFQIPARSTTDISCDAKMPPGLPNVHLFAAFPHMHQLGTTISTVKMEQGVPGTPLGAQASWDFQNQSYFPIDGTLRGGDTVRTRCAWKNPGDTSVAFGERTEDEMCFSFTMYWPRYVAPDWGWMTPTLDSRCSPTTTP